MRNNWQEEPLNAGLLFRRKLGDTTTVVENPKNHAPEQYPDNTTTRSVRKRKLTNNSTPIPKPDNQPNGLPTPTPIDNSISLSNPAKKLALPHLQFGDFTISEPPNTYDHEEHNERCEQPSLDWQ